jgi:hypothetical protein
MKKPVRDQVNGLSTVEFFTLLADLMKRNLPTRPRSSASRPLALFPTKASTARRSTRGGTVGLPQLSHDRIMLHAMSLSRRRAARALTLRNRECERCRVHAVIAPNRVDTQGPAEELLASCVADLISMVRPACTIPTLRRRSDWSRRRGQHVDGL